MKIYKAKFYIIYLSAILMVSIAIPSTSFARGSVPIPKRRPDVLSVSPAYIKELMSRKDVVTPKEVTNKNSHIETQPDPTTETRHGNVEIFSGDNNGLPPSFMEPSAGTDIEKPVETTLVSFALDAGQTNLDTNIKYFLKEKAIDLFKNNENLKMEIHAFATAIDGQEDSDVRISLARALEVRSFLIAHDIKPDRLALSPMKQDNIGSADRIDLIFLEK